MKPEGPSASGRDIIRTTSPRPYIDVKTILYRDDPILTCAAAQTVTRPVAQGIAGRHLARAGGVRPAGNLGRAESRGRAATRFTATRSASAIPAIRATSCTYAAARRRHNGKWTVVVDRDIDCSDLIGCGRCARASTR